MTFDAAVLEEREACAKICDDADKSTHPADLADRIRGKDSASGPQTHEEATALIAWHVRRIEIIANHFGYDPHEWLSDNYV